jgi:hypothetical protein
MGFNLAALFNPYFISLAGGLFVGGYFSLMLRFPQKQEKKEKLKRTQRRWGGVLLLLGPMTILLGALFFPAPDYLTVTWLVFFGVSILLFFAIFRFPRAVGIPVVLIFGLVFYAGWVEMRTWVRVRPGEELLSYQWMPTDGGGNVKITHGINQESAFAQSILDKPLPLQELNLPIWGELLGGRRWLRPAYGQELLSPGENSSPSAGEGEILARDWFEAATYLQMMGWVETVSLTWPARVPWQEQHLWFRAGRYYWSEEGG